MFFPRGHWIALSSFGGGVMVAVMVAAIAVASVVAALDFERGAGATGAGTPPLRGPSNSTDGGAHFASAANSDGETIYLVGSEGEARGLLTELDELNRVRHALGLPPLPAEVLTVASADEAHRIENDFNELSAIRRAQGLGLYMVVVMGLSEREP